MGLHRRCKTLVVGIHGEKLPAPLRQHVGRKEWIVKMDLRCRRNMLVENE